jgi:hypothetical protein
VSIGCAAAYQEAAKEKGNAAFHHEFLHMIVPGIGDISAANWFAVRAVCRNQPGSGKPMSV